MKNCNISSFIYFFQEQNTDDAGIDGDTVEEIQNEEAPIIENAHLISNINEINGFVKEEIEVAAREFVENEIKAAINEVTPITQEIESELKDIDELLYDEIRKEEQAELQAVLAKRTAKEIELEEEILPNREVAVVYDEDLTKKQESEILNAIETKQETAVKYEEEKIPEEQQSAISDVIEARQETAIEYEEENVSKEQTSEILNEIESKPETVIEYEEEKVPEEQQTAISTVTEVEHQTALEFEPEVLAKEQKSEVEGKQETAVEYKKELVPEEHQIEISNSELTETTQVTTLKAQKQELDLDNLDPDEYEIEEYEVEVDEDEDVNDEIVIIDENESVPHSDSNNVPRE